LQAQPHEENEENEHVTTCRRREWETENNEATGGGWWCQEMVSICGALSIPLSLGLFMI